MTIQRTRPQPSTCSRTLPRPQGWLPALVACAVLWPAACTDDQRVTQLVLIVDSDWQDLARVSVTLHNFGDGEPIPIDLQKTRPPRTLGIVHTGGPLGPIDVTVSGYKAGDISPSIVEPRTGVYFVRDQIRALRVELRARCVGVCDPEQACLIDSRGARSCRAGSEVNGLIPWEGEDAIDRLLPDEVGDTDGGTQPGADGGDGDAGDIDGGLGDAAACSTDCALRNEIPNATARCSGGTCQLACDDGFADCDDDADNGCEVDLSGYCGPCASHPGKRKALTIDGSKVQGALSDFPVLVALDDPDLSATSIDASDLCFASGDTTNRLPFDLDVWDQPTGGLRAWVRIPTLAGGSDSVMHVYYGSGLPGQGPSPQDVWDEDYRAVLHLGDTTDAARGQTGTAVDTTSEPGLFGDGFSFNGSESYLELAQDTFDNLFDGGATVEAWIKPIEWGGGGYGRIFDKATDTDGDTGWNLFVCDGLTYANEQLCFTRGSGIGVWQSPSSSIALGAWHHVAVVFDQDAFDESGTPPRIYIDGIGDDGEGLFGPGDLPQDDADIPLRIGNHPGTASRGFQGTMDEIRISKTLRSPEWLGTQFENQTDPNAFIRTGPEEAVP